MSHYRNALQSIFSGLELTCLENVGDRLVDIKIEFNDLVLDIPSLLDVFKTLFGSTNITLTVSCDWYNEQTERGGLLVEFIIKDVQTFPPEAPIPEDALCPFHGV